MVVPVGRLEEKSSPILTTLTPTPHPFGARFHVNHIHCLPRLFMRTVAHSHIHPADPRTGCARPVISFSSCVQVPTEFRFDLDAVTVDRDNDELSVPSGSLTAASTAGVRVRTCASSGVGRSTENTSDKSLKTAKPTYPALVARGE